jgi:1-acyl-sn-glycerol-3-phosphate acyltransferase
VHGTVPAQPAIYVANHASYIDAVILTALLPAGARFVAKREFASVPVLGWLLARIGARFVERFEAREAIESARELTAVARAGDSLVIYPEGTFTREPGLRPFHMGAFVAAAQSARPVVPVALRGTRSVLRDGSWLPRRAPVGVFVEAALAPQGAGWSEAIALRDAARKAILARCGEPERYFKPMQLA